MTEFLLILILLVLIGIGRGVPHGWKQCPYCCMPMNNSATVCPSCRRESEYKPYGALALLGYMAIFVAIFAFLACVWFVLGVMAHIGGA
jgi:hypothetical protein